MSDFANSSSVQLVLIPEATFGVTPTTGTAKKKRMTGESLAFDVSKEASQEINSRRTVSSMSVVGASASGGVQAEMQYAEYDDLIAATLQNTYTVYGTNGVGATFTADFTATTITASVAPTGSSAFTTLQRGQWFRVTAGSSANNGKLLRVSTSTAPTSTVITLDTNTPAVVASAVANVALQTSRLTHGSTQTSFSIERQITDLATPEFFNFRGMTPSKLDMSVSTGALTSLSFEFMGKDAVRSTTTSQLPASPAESQTYEVHSGVSNTSACQIWIGTAPQSSVGVTSLSLSFDNVLRSQEGLCALGAVGIGSGTIACTVEAEMYFANGALFDAFVSNANQQIIFSSLDASGNGYVFTLPKMNITSYSAPPSGKDSDLMASVSFMALSDDGNAIAALRKLLFVDRVGAAVTA